MPNKGKHTYINAAYINFLFDANSAEIRNFFSKFFLETQGQLDALNQAIVDSDEKKFNEILHILKGAFSMSGISELFDFSVDTKKTTSIDWVNAKKISYKIERILIKVKMEVDQKYNRSNEMVFNNSYENKPKN